MYYLSDAVFLATLESDDKAFLERIAAALKSPVYPLYLGRRSCPPTLPVVLGIRDDKLIEVLKNEPSEYTGKLAEFGVSYGKGGDQK